MRKIEGAISVARAWMQCRCPLCRWCWIPADRQSALDWVGSVKLLPAELVWFLAWFGIKTLRVLKESHWFWNFVSAEKNLWRFLFLRQATIRSKASSLWVDPAKSNAAVHHFSLAPELLFSLGFHTEIWISICRFPVKSIWRFHLLLSSGKQSNKKHHWAS